MTPTEQATLFGLARAAIQARLAGSPPPELPPSTPALARAAGVFVTLRLRGALRGCIGRIQTERPLTESVRDLAEAAAFGDRRFKPLGAEEYPELELELSVLTPTQVLSPESLPGAVQVGTHGLIVRLHGRSGLLLPQVAAERNWDALTFLQQTSLKAGLPEDAWSVEGAVVEAFRCEIYEEH